MIESKITSDSGWVYESRQEDGSIVVTMTMTDEFARQVEIAQQQLPQLIVDHIGDHRECLGYWLMLEPCEHYRSREFSQIDMAADISGIASAMLHIQAD